MKSHQPVYLLVNFGGPRSLEEIPEFLTSLLTDQDVIQTKFPKFLHRLLFSRIARKRAKKVIKDYELIGGKSPIYEDTEIVARLLSGRLDADVITFHRYLPSTHEHFLQTLNRLESAEITIFPMFPQFCYATTGSIARWLEKHVSKQILNRMNWIKSYSGHAAYTSAFKTTIREFLHQNHFKEEETLLFYSAHGVPYEFIKKGDPYQKECELSFKKIAEAFPSAKNLIAYQSKFGSGEWLCPYTKDVCEDIFTYSKGRKQVVFVPLSFTSDHIETLFEVEHEYLPIIRQQGLDAYRCPALNKSAHWIAAIAKIMQEASFSSNQMLIRHN